MGPHERTSPPAPTDEWVGAVRGELLRWGTAHSQSYPWRDDGLPLWQALVAEFLLLRTRADQVAPVFEKIRRCYPSAHSFGDASEEHLSETISSLGLRWRLPLFVRLARTIGECDGDIPSTTNELMKFPGVGTYVAAATAALHGGTRASIVDSNIVRLLCRLTGQEYDGETRRKRWLVDLADRLTPDVEFRAYGYAALDLSMMICRPRQPLCADCPLAELCVSGGNRTTSR